MAVSVSKHLLVEQLNGVSVAVGDLIARLRVEQWSAPTPCTEWTVQQLVKHLIGMNRFFVALLDDGPPTSSIGR